MALHFVPAIQNPIRVLLDTTRIGPWEVFYAALPFRGRTLPICWLVIPYPRPKKAFHKALNDLLDLIDQSWPVGRQYVIVADRGFPSQDLFQRSQQNGQGWTVRLLCSSPVIIQGQKVRADSFISQVPNGEWPGFPVTYYAQYSRSNRIKGPRPIP